MKRSGSGKAPETVKAPVQAATLAAALVCPDCGTSTPTGKICTHCRAKRASAAAAANKAARAPAVVPPGRLCQDCNAPLSASNTSGYCRSCGIRIRTAQAREAQTGGVLESPLKGNSVEDLFKPTEKPTVESILANETQDPYETECLEPTEDPEPEPIIRRAVMAPAVGYLAGIVTADRLSIPLQNALNAAIASGLKIHRVRRFEIHQSCDTGVFYPVPLRTVPKHGSQRVCLIQRMNGQVTPEFKSGFSPVEITE